MKVIVIEPDKSPEVRDVEDELGSFTTIVDGYLQAIPFMDGAIALVDEDAKVRIDKVVVVNTFATIVCKYALATINRMMMPGDYIAHTMVILGDLDEHGETDGEFHDVPQTVIDFVMERAAEFEFES